MLVCAAIYLRVLGSFLYGPRCIVPIGCNSKTNSPEGDQSAAGSPWPSGGEEGTDGGEDGISIGGTGDSSGHSSDGEGNAAAGGYKHNGARRPSGDPELAECMVVEATLAEYTYPFFRCNIFFVIVVVPAEFYVSVLCAHGCCDRPLTIPSHPIPSHPL